MRNEFSSFAATTLIVALLGAILLVKIIVLPLHTLLHCWRALFPRFGRAGCLSRPSL